MKRKRFTLVYGASGYGKGTFAEGAGVAWQRAIGRTVWIDPAGDLEPYGHCMGVQHFLQVIKAYGPRDPFALVVQPQWGEKLEDIDKRTKAVKYSVWRAIYEAGNVHVLLDETHRVASASRIDAGLGELVATGRHRCIHLTTTVRTPPELHPTFRGNADAVVSFRQTSERYAGILAKEFFGEDERMAQLLNKLEKYEYLRIETATGELSRGRVEPTAIRKAWAAQRVRGVAQGGA